MNISTLIESLERIKKDHGELEVNITGTVGNMAIVDIPIKSVNYSLVYYRDNKYPDFPYKKSVTISI